jgi:site-specific recombinase XerD
LELHSNRLLTAQEKDVRLFLVAQSEAGKSAATIAQMVSALRTYYRFLQEEGYREDHPMMRIQQPKKGKREPRIVSDEILHSLIQAMRADTLLGQRDYVMFSLLFTTGLRASELCELTFHRINFVEGTIRVVGKGKKERQVLYPTVLNASFYQYLEAFKPLHALKRTDDRVFLSHFGEAITRQQLYQRLQYYRQRAGITRRLSPHMLRHSFATYVLQNGADIRVVQELLGHQSLATTQIYLDMTTQHIREQYLALMDTPQKEKK